MIFLAPILPITAIVVAYLAWQRIDRRWPGLPFRAVFYGGVAICVAWLGVGIAPAIVNRSAAWHDAFHRVAKDEGITTEVRAANNLFDRDTLILPGDRDVVITFRNQDRGIRHNVAIYGLPLEEFREEDSEEFDEFPVLDPSPFAGPGVREYVIRTPGGEATYSFRCVVHPVTMRGTVTLTTETAEINRPVWRAIAGRIASVSHGAERGWQTGIDYLFSLLNLALAVLLVRLRGDDVVARLFALAAISTAAATNLQSHASLAVIPSFADLHDTVLHPFAGFTYVFAVVMFPEGRLIPHLRRRRLRVVVSLATVVAILALLGVSGVLLPDPGLGHALGYLKFFGLVIPAIGMLAQGYKMRWRADTPERRQQSKLLIWALLPALLAGFAFFLAGSSETGYAFGSEPGRVIFRIVEPLFALIPIALFVGILRYRLWDLDLVVSKTLLFGALAVFIGAVYVGIVVGIGEAIGTRGEPNTGLSILATAIVAIAFQPLRARLERVANRIVFGERATPYEVLAGLASRMSGALSPDEVLPGMAEAAARGLRASSARVRLFLADGRERVVVWPDRDGAREMTRTLPVGHHGETLGEIGVEKAPGDPLRPADEELLSALAAQAGVAMHNLRLAEELRARLDEISAQARELAASRLRLETARIAQQRRLERDISDRVERRIVGIAEGLVRAEESVADPAEGSRVLAEVGARASECLETLRDLASDIFRRLLADRGLVPALEALVAKHGFARLTADSSADRRFDPQVETAVYFCCLEALLNVERHAPASTATVRIARAGDWVEFSVADSGPGFDPANVSQDSDLHLMIDRVEAIGGTLEFRSARGEGTTVAGRVPAQPPV